MGLWGKNQWKATRHAFGGANGPCVPQHASDPVLHFAEQVVLPGTASAKTSRHSSKSSDGELPAPLGHRGQAGFAAALNRPTPHVSVAWQPD